MNLENLNIFMQAAEAGSYTAAARRLGTDPSVVSRAIANLERELGFRLFHRSTRKIALTSAGATYLARIAPLLEEFRQAQECAREETTTPQGRLSITASTSFGQIRILPYIAEFQERYPRVQLDLRFTDAVLDILEERIDLACRLTAHADPNLVGRKLFSTRFRVCATPAYLAAHGTPGQPADLEYHRTLVFNLPGYRDRWLFQPPRGHVFRVPLQPAMLLSNALAMVDAAMRGLGIAMLASWLADEHIKDGRLVRLFPEYEVTATDFQSAAWLLYPSRRFIPAKTRAMVDFLCEKHRQWESDR